MEHLLETWGYLAVFVLSFMSAMGLPVGSEVAIIYGGVLASGQIPNEPHHLNLIGVIVVAILAELAGSTVGYLIGSRGGRPLLDRLGRYVLVTHKDLDRAEEWFARHGQPVVLFGRFVPLLRSFVSVAAGLGEMAFAKFVIFTVVGCALWCSALASLGDSLGSSYSHVLKAFSYTGYLAAALFVVAVAIGVVHRLRTVRMETARLSATPPLERPASLPLVVPATSILSDLSKEKLVIDMTEEEIHAWVATTVTKIRTLRQIVEMAGPHLKAMISAHDPASETAQRESHVTEPGGT